MKRSKALNAAFLCIVTIFTVFISKISVTEVSAEESYSYYSDGTKNESVVRYIALKLKDCPDEIYIGDYNITPDELSDIVTDIILSRPDIFYLSPVYSYNFSSKTNYVKYFYPEYLYQKASIERMSEEMDEAAEEILSGLDDTLPDELKALYIHDKLVLDMEYDIENQKRSAYEALVVKKALCVSYSLGFKYLAEKAGLECVCVISDDLDHCWNMVNIDSEWYNIDTTSDDPTPDYYGYVSHEYFLVSDETAGEGYTNKTMGYSSTSKSFEGKAWRNSTSRVIILDQKCYYIDSKLKAIYCYDYENGYSKKLFTVGDKWKNPGGGCYINSMSKLEYDGERFYYITPTSIKSFTLEGKIRNEYTAKLEDGYSIFGMKIIGRTIYVQYSDDLLEGPEQTVKTINVSDESSLKVPENFKGVYEETNGKYKITLSWKKVNVASGYIVYKYDKETKSAEKLYTTTKNKISIKNLSAGNYTYIVCAVNSINGNEIKSDYSSVVNFNLK